MKAVMLAGGLGSRLSEETILRPEPMVEVGERPILWHIMNIYSAHGINDFVICLGYKGIVIKEYFANYFFYSADVTMDLEKNEMEFHRHRCEPWRVTLIDTGVNTMTGGRLKRVLPYVADEEAFCFTYGDGLADVNISELVAFHRRRGKLPTLTPAQPSGKFRALHIDGGSPGPPVTEKPKGDHSWARCGVFVISPNSADYVQN